MTALGITMRSGRLVSGNSLLRIFIIYVTLFNLLPTICKSFLDALRVLKAERGLQLDEAKNVRMQLDVALKWPCMGLMH